MKLSLIISILAAHWIADFVMQTDRMAKGKSSSNLVLLEHIYFYTSCLGLILLISSVLWMKAESILPLCAFVSMNSVAHFTTDYFTSRWTSRLWKEQRVHAFFVVIGFDQLLHYVVLFGTAWWTGI